jgi:hypothetical protein
MENDIIQDILNYDFKWNDTTHLQMKDIHSDRVIENDNKQEEAKIELSLTSLVVDNFETLPQFFNYEREI